MHSGVDQIHSLATTTGFGGNWTEGSALCFPPQVRAGRLKVDINRGGRLLASPWQDGRSPLTGHPALGLTLQFIVRHEPQGSPQTKNQTKSSFNLLKPSPGFPPPSEHLKSSQSPQGPAPSASCLLPSFHPPLLQAQDLCTCWFPCSEYCCSRYLPGCLLFTST